MRTVDFILVGVPKAGTTWLERFLREQPQVVLPKVKDLYFFDENYDKGVQWYHSQFPDFVGLRHEAKVGELSHNYMYSREALLRIREYNPHVKILVALRAPHTRAISQFKFFKRDGLLTGGLDSIPVWAEEFIYQWSNYSHYVSDVISIFSRNNVHFFILEKFSKNPYPEIVKLCLFLGLDAPEQNELDASRVNVASAPRSRGLARLSKRVANTLRRMGLLGLLGWAKRSKLVKGMIYKESVVEVDDQLVKELRGYFQGEVQEMEALLGVNLEEWKL